MLSRLTPLTILSWLILFSPKNVIFTPPDRSWLYFLNSLSPILKNLKARYKKYAPVSKDYAPVSKDKVAKSVVIILNSFILLFKSCNILLFVLIEKRLNSTNYNRMNHHIHCFFHTIQWHEI